jgi:hypothetical protein
MRYMRDAESGFLQTFELTRTLYYTERRFHTPERPTNPTIYTIGLALVVRTVCALVVAVLVACSA